MEQVKLVIFSICKDEAETIGELLDRMPRKIKGVSKIEHIVIDDGSTDDTVAIAEKHGALVYGGSQQKRLAYRFQQAILIALDRGADFAVNIDGDLQFSPEDIPIILDPVLNGEYDFAAADRFTNPKNGEMRKPENMSFGKYYANRLGAWIVGNLTGHSFNDVTCGFRAYNRDAMYAININSTYTYTQESFQVLALKKFNIAAVPVFVKYYPGRKSRVVRSFWQFLFGSALNILRAYRDYAPLRFFGFSSLLMTIPGLFMGAFVCWHWATTGTISPYIAVGILALFLVGVGIMLGLLGLVADMLDRLLHNQEKILEHNKRLLHKDKEK